MKKILFFLSLLSLPAMAQDQSISFSPERNQINGGRPCLLKRLFTYKVAFLLGSNGWNLKFLKAKKMKIWRIPIPGRLPTGATLKIMKYLSPTLFEAARIIP